MKVKLQRHKDIDDIVEVWGHTFLVVMQTHDKITDWRTDGWNSLFKSIFAAKRRVYELFDQYVNN